MSNICYKQGCGNGVVFQLCNKHLMELEAARDENEELRKLRVGVERQLDIWESCAKALSARDLDYAPFQELARTLQSLLNGNWENNDESPSTVEVCVKKPEDWSKLWVLDPQKELREALRCVEILTRDLYGMPFIYTIPSPLIQAMNGISTPEQVYNDIKENQLVLRRERNTLRYG